MAEYFGDPDFDFEHLAGDVVKMGEIVTEKIEANEDEFVKALLIEHIRVNDNEMFVGDLLDDVFRLSNNDHESVATAWNSLSKMQDDGLVIMYISDGDRYTVSLTRSSK